jgi:tight adherence protein C
VQGSLLSRTLGGALKKFLDLLGRFTPQTMAHKMDHQLTVAGRPGNLTAAGFFGLRLLLLLVGLGFAYLLNRDPAAISLNSLLFGLLAAVVCWLLPSVWLRGKMRARQDEVQRGLPDALDMLSVCASAGLGFDQSLQKISQYWDTEFGRELQRATNEMEMGLSRAEALRHMSARLDVDDLTRFIATIVQAERIGMSYADVLHSQAEQMRVLRQLRAREFANRLPAKITIPLVLFIFPAMLIVILGPAIPTLLSAF